MRSETLDVYASLLKAHRLLKSGGWPDLVKALPPRSDGPATVDAHLVADRCVRAARRLPVETACLERSYATCSVLRRRGVDSLFVVGVSRVPPMRFHAWVEVDGEVLGEVQPVHDIYRTMCAL